MPYSVFYGRTEAVKLMLKLGFDPMARGMDGGTLLHAACWVGNAEIVELLLRDYRNRIDLNARDPKHSGTPLGWAIHGSTNCGYQRANHARAVELLIEAGVRPANLNDLGSDAVRAVLLRNGIQPQPSQNQQT